MMVDGGVTTWLAENRVNGTVVARVGRRGDELVAEFSNLGVLTSSPGGSAAHFEPALGVSTRVVERLRSTVIDALVRHARGKMTLHGGAICMGSRAVALVGPSGSGKSTLTAALCAEQDVELLADETVAIELSEIRPGPIDVARTQTAVSLLPDARRALGFDAMVPCKAAVPLGVGSSDNALLTAVVGLVFTSEAKSPELRKLRGQEAFSTLANALFRFIVDDPTALLREFDQLRAIAAHCDIYELRRPRDLHQLKDTAGLIRRILAASPLPESVR